MTPSVGWVIVVMHATRAGALQVQVHVAVLCCSTATMLHLLDQVATSSLSCKQITP